MPLIVIPTGAVYLFSVASKGGLRCINAINRAYGARMNARGRTWVCRSLKLHPDSYKHPRYGKIFVPVLHVVNWTGADGNRCR